MTEIYNSKELQQRGIGLATFIKGQWAASSIGLAWLMNYLYAMGLRTMDITTQTLEDLAHWVPHGQLRAFSLVAAPTQDYMGQPMRQLSCYLEGVGLVGLAMPWHNPDNRPRGGNTEFLIHSWEVSGEESGYCYVRAGSTGKSTRHQCFNQARLSLALDNIELDTLKDQGRIEVVLTPPHGGHLWRCDCGAVLEDGPPMRL